MKKKLLIVVTACLMLGAAACGKKADGTAASSGAETTAESSTEASTETATAEPSSEAIETNSIYATIQSAEGSKITVETEDGKSMTFDISKAKQNPAYELMQGDEVEIEYEGSEPIDGMAVTQVIMSTPFELTSEDYNEDPTVWGQIVAADAQSITVREENNGPGDEGASDGTEYKFSLAPYAQVITKDGLNSGAYVLVTYTGELDSNPVAYRLCTEDMEEDASSDLYIIAGTVDKVEDGIVYLTTADGTAFKFSASDDLLPKAKVGEQVQMVYSGSIRQRVLPADDILTP